MLRLIFAFALPESSSLAEFYHDQRRVYKSKTCTLPQPTKANLTMCTSFYGPSSMFLASIVSSGDGARAVRLLRRLLGISRSSPSLARLWLLLPCVRSWHGFQPDKFLPTAQHSGPTTRP